MNASSASSSPSLANALDAVDPEQARELAGLLASLYARRSSQQVRMVVLEGVQGSGSALDLPAQLLQFLAHALEVRARGAAVTLVSGQRPLAGRDRITTADAAQMLGVSRPFLVAQIDAGRLRCVKVGAHRRLLLEDVQSYARDHMGLNILAGAADSPPSP